MKISAMDVVEHIRCTRTAYEGPVGEGQAAKIYSSGMRPLGVGFTELAAGGPMFSVVPKDSMPRAILKRIKADEGACGALTILAPGKGWWLKRHDLCAIGRGRGDLDRGGEFILRRYNDFVTLRDDVFVEGEVVTCDDYRAKRFEHVFERHPVMRAIRAGLDMYLVPYISDRVNVRAHV